MKFYDNVKIEVKSGDGGDGAICFVKNKKGFFKKCSRLNGGDGGDVYITADRNKISLFNYFYKKKYIALNGFKGSCSMKLKKNTENFILIVPLGTVITDLNNNNKFELIENKTYLLAKGGLGGIGFFINFNYLNKKFNNKGGLGVLKKFKLDFNIFSDIILIGFPNTGKSSFFSSISNLNSKVSNYVFTTLNLCKANIKYNSLKNLIIIDMPGFIKNSYYGLGLGLNFLKHLIKTKLILHFIDLSLLNLNLLCFIENINTINNEIYKYNKLNFYKPIWLIFNKLDLIMYLNFKLFIDIYLKKKNWYNKKFFLISIKKKNCIFILYKIHKFFKKSNLI